MNNNPYLVTAYLDPAVNFISVYRFDYDHSLLKAVRPVSEISLMKGHGIPALAAFCGKDKKLAIFFRLREVSFIHIYNADTMDNSFLLKVKL